MPSTLSALAGAEAGFEVPISDIETQIAGTAAASASVAIQPPSLDLAAALQAAATIPGVTVSVEGLATLGISLGNDLLALEAALGLVIAVTGPFSSVGVHAWAIEDEIGNMGPALSGVLAGGIPGGSGPAQQGLAVVLVAADNGAIAALRALFAL
jgi:hypothetical protein